MVACAFLGAGCMSGGSDGQVRDSLKTALTLHASFDHGLDADFAKGDPVLRTAPSMAKRTEGKPGLPDGGPIHVARGEGVTGDALRFGPNPSAVVHYAALNNVAWNPTNWSGTVSFWLKLDPQTDLQPGYADPIQLTSHAWNDAAFFVEFTPDDKPRHCRLGAYSDFKVWNPKNQKWEEMPFEEKPLVRVTHPPFQRDQWTHVAFTWEHFNTGRAEAIAQLYLDGELKGTIGPRVQTFTWELERALVMLGLSYSGLWDELAIFNRSLTPGEILKLKMSPGILASPRVSH